MGAERSLTEGEGSTKNNRLANDLGSGIAFASATGSISFGPSSAKATLENALHTEAPYGEQVAAVDRHSPMAYT